MKHLLSSKVIFVILGGLIYIGVTMWTLHYSMGEWKFKPNQKADGTQIGIDPNLDGPSWNFRNPEMDLLVQDLYKRAKAIEKKEKELRLLDARVQKDIDQLSSITNRMRSLQDKFERSATALTKNEEQNIESLLGLFKTLEPEQIGTILEEMSNQKIAKIFRLLKPAEFGPVVELWLSKDEKTETRIHAILKIYEGVIPEENLPDE
ncbi:hypothetical protein OAM00_02150 [Verrucomicrobia bacterium]|nr:hypothetical protein [bacterium]MDC0299563.1 hypothetical protein [Verrucomicrobiota bacterium]